MVRPAIEVRRGTKVLGSMVVRNQVPLQAAAEFAELEGCDGKRLQRIRTVLSPTNARLQRHGTCQQFHFPILAVGFIKGDGELPFSLGKDIVYQVAVGGVPIGINDVKGALPSAMVQSITNNRSMVFSLPSPSSMVSMVPPLSLTEPLAGFRSPH